MIKSFLNRIISALKGEKRSGVYYIHGPETLPAPLSQKEEAEDDEELPLRQRDEGRTRPSEDQTKQHQDPKDCFIELVKAQLE